VEDPNYGGLVTIVLAILGSTGLWEFLKLRLQKKSEPQQQLNTIQESINQLTNHMSDVKDSVNDLKVDLTKIRSDVDILQAATKETELYRQVREEKEDANFKVYKSERDGMINALKLLMQDRLIANADACMEKGYYTREERITFHAMYELYISEPFNDGNPVVVGLQPKMVALPYTKEEADSQSDVDKKLKELIKL